MCNFLSGLFLRNGDFICYPEITDSHEDLISVGGYTDKFCEQFVRLEYTPDPRSGPINNLNTWRFIFDSPTIPSWFDERARECAEEKMSRRISSMFVEDERDIILGGCWILVGAKVRRCKGARIVSMWDSCIHSIQDDTRVDAMMDNSIINYMYSNTRVCFMKKNSIVRSMFGNSRIECMYDNSAIEDMLDEAYVREMTNNSTVKNMYDNSLIGLMHGNSAVKRMWGESRIRKSAIGCQH